MNAVTRAYEAKIDDVIPGERSVVAKINTSGVDRYRTVIQPQGAQLDGYRKNPVVLWEHGKDPQRGTMPVGRNQWIKVDHQQIVAKTIFRNDDYSQQLFEAYQDGGLRGWSVNILPSESSPPTKEEMRSAPDWSDCQMVYRKWELAEYSGVSVPGNADTLTLIAARGIWVPDDARPVTRELPQSEYGPKHLELGSSSTGLCEPGECIACDRARPEARTGIFVQHSDSQWHVFNGEQRMASFATELLAQECVALLNAHCEFDPQVPITQTLGQVRSMSAELKQDMIDYIDLYRYGRV